MRSRVLFKHLWKKASELVGAGGSRRHVGRTFRRRRVALKPGCSCDTAIHEQTLSRGRGLHAGSQVWFWFCRSRTTSSGKATCLRTHQGSGRRVGAFFDDAPSRQLSTGSSPPREQRNTGRQTLVRTTSHIRIQLLEGLHAYEFAGLALGETSQRELVTC